MTEAQKPWEQQYDSGATDEGAEPWKQNYGAPRGLKGWKSGSNSGFDAPKPSAFEGVKDSAIALGTGVTQGIGMLANVAGADNAVSRTMDDATKALSEYESPYRKAEKQERARKIKEAEESGSTLKEVGAYLGSFAEAPLDTTLNALGTSLPTLAAGFIPGAGQAAVAARVAQLGLGAAQGVGAVKGQIFDEVKQARKEKGATEEDASARAAQAQSYTGDNAGSIALGGALGAVAGSSGAEASVRRLAGKELAERAAQTSVLKGMGMGALKEAPMEGLQGGQERLASNLALQNEGFDQGTWTGVAGGAALEAMASAPMGAGFGAWEAGSQQRRAEIEQSGAGDGELTRADEWSPPNASEGEIPPLEPGMNIDTRGLRISPTNDESAVPFEEVQAEGPSGPGMRIDTSGLSTQDYPGELVGPNPAQREWDTGGLAISDQPQKPSEAMGLRTGPDAGPLENAAALSVDTGATAQMQGAAGIVANDLQSEPQAANAMQAVNLDAVADPYERAMLQRLYDDHFADGDLESVISANAELDTSFDFGANVNQLLADAGATPQEIEDAQRGQASAQAADRPGQAQENDRGDFDAELSVAKNEGDGSGRLAGAEQGEASQQPLDQQAAAPGSQAEGANVATLAQLNRKKLAEMSDDELQQLSTLLPADHSRQTNIQKAIQDRATQAQPATNIGAKEDAPQTDQAQQAIAQPTQAGAAQAGQPTGQGLNNGATPAENDGRQASAPTAPQAQAQELDRQQRAKRLDDAGAQWTRMPAAERSALVDRLEGVKPVLAKNMPRAEWGNLNADIQRKLADAMGTTPARDSSANNPENKFQSAPEWWTGRSEDERRLLISVTNRLSGNAFANATTEWDSLSSEQKAFLAKEYDKYVSGDASVGPKAIAKVIVSNGGKSSAPKPNQPPTQAQQVPAATNQPPANLQEGNDAAQGQPPASTKPESEIKKGDARALFSGKAMDRTRKAVPADARAMEQFIADGKEAEFQRLLSIRQTGRDNLTDEETSQFYDLRTERNQAKAAVENAGRSQIKSKQPAATETAAPTAQQQTDAQGNDAESVTPEAGPFGPIFDGFENNPEGAIAKLMQEKRGEVPDAFTHPELGSIAFIYGDEGMGLRHIEAKRGIQWVHRIPAILRNGRLERDQKLPRAYLVQDGDPAGVAVIRLDWDGEQKTWLVTAHPDDKGKWSGVGKTSRTADNESGLVQGNPSQSSPQGDSATTSKAKQPITRADVEAAQQQAAASIGARIDAMSAGDVNKIAKKFLPTMGMKPTMSKANNKAAMTDAKINLEAAAAEVGAVLPAEVTRALQADMEGRVVDAAKPAAPAQQEASKPKKLPPFPVDGYRLEGYYANGAKVKPLPAKAFSPTEVQAITDWFKSIGWSVTSGSGANGVNATNDVGMTVDDLPEPYTAAQRKKDEAQKAADERAADKKNAQDDYLASNDAGKFVSDMFGDSMNRFNLTALAKVLAGDEKTFGGLFSNRAADVLADAGISTEGRQVKDIVADIKATFDAAQQDAKNPARAAADGLAAAKQEPGKRIEDFGEKLEGARKDLPPSLKEEVSDEQMVSLPLSKIWPANAHEEIQNDAAAALAFAARQAIPAKPRQSVKVQRWVQKVKNFRALVTSDDALAGNLDKLGLDGLSQRVGAGSVLEGFFAKVRLLTQLPRDTWGRVEKVGEYPDAVRYGEDGKKTPAPFSAVVIDGEVHQFDGAKSIGPDEVSKIKELLGAAAPKKGGLTAEDFEIRTYKNRAESFINRKGDKEMRPLKTFTGQESGKQAREWLKANVAQAEAQWEAVKARDNVGKSDVRTAQNRQRVGADHRKGADVTAQMFEDAFGFRGVQFGNWVAQGAGAKDRQGLLNEAYDALMDLSLLLGVPSRAMSLDGSLGLSLGARGSGKAAAHFEHDSLVINLTKTKGAGSLAHEWFHALDNYFRRQRGGMDKQAGREDAYITYKPEAAWVPKAGTRRAAAPLTSGQLRQWLQARGMYDGGKSLEENAKAANFERDPQHKDGVRPQVEAAFAQLVQALNDSPMAARATVLDGGAVKGYWGRIIERGARSFENYVINKMALQGYSNDFLANIHSFDEWQALGKNAERYPYLTPAEEGPVVEAFDNLFETIETRQGDDGNVGLYFAANPARRPGTAQDKAVMQAIADGKSARDVLRLIANGSKDPFLRQVARLLLKAGITPNIQFGHIGKTKKGDPIHGQYRGKSDTIAMAGSAEYAAERIFMHEAMHAATMRALAKPGLPKLQLQKLLEHVRKNGGAAGFYGLKNVDEFVAEVFTNPDFQSALRTMSAPVGSPLKSAWHSFVQVLRRILGLGDNSTSVLSQALELGVAAVRQDMVLRRQGARASGRANAGTDAIDQTQTAAFKRWFGDWEATKWDGASVVREPAVSSRSTPQDMPPKVVYHGTRKDFASFAPVREGNVVTMFGDEDTVVRRGIFFAENPEFAATFAAQSGEGSPQVMPVYLNIRNPMFLEDGFTSEYIDELAAAGFDDAERLRHRKPEMVWAEFDDEVGEQFVAAAKAAGYDGVYMREQGRGLDGEEDQFVWVAFDPEQVKSATGNNGNFDPDDPDILNFGADNFAALKASALDQISQSLSHPGKVSLWDKTVGTMRNLAERVPQFKPVFEAAQRFIDDVSMLANDAADFAPRLMPRVESWGDLKKKPITAADNKAVAKPLFEGTLMWARDLDGTPVTTEALNAKYRNTSADEKAQVMLRTGKLDDRVLKMWKGMPIESYEKAVASKFDSTILKPGVVWSQKELKDIFKLDDKQVGLYQEARAAIDRSLDMTARTDMLRLLGDEFAGMRSMVLEQESLKDAFDLVLDTLQEEARANPDMADRLMDINNSVVNRYETATELMDKGYAPLSRFGKYTVDVVDANGERQYFGMFESIREANQMAMKMRDVFKGAAVTQGTMSEQAFKLFQGITPESLEMFGSMLGLKGEGSEAQDKAFQAYLQLAKNNHSALKRLIHRKGIDGYSEDVGRVLASFVYSNARLGSQGLNAGTMETAIEGIPKEMGELRDVAMGLRNYIQDPQEEGQAVRGMLFAQYLGGSVASAFVNMTQPFQITMPWLSQYGGMGQAAKQMARALKDMGTKGFKYEADLAKALQSAEDDGVVSPQEIHQLMAQARGTGSLRTGDGTKLGDARATAANNWERVKVAWGQPFALAEQFNRRSTFIASYRIAKAQGMADPAEFARRAVLETQFLYSKANKMRWGRGAIGGTLMTFKTYSVSYLELMHRMWNQGEPGSPERAAGRRAVGWAVAMLLLMGGAGGLPFMEDAEDLIDMIGQMMGYNLSTKQARKEFLADIVGKEMAEFMEQGVSGLPGAPIDVSGRLGMGNLIPGTGLFLSKQNRERDLTEIAGPAGDLVTRGFSAGKSVLSGVLNADASEFSKAAMEIAPTAVRNAAKGIDMATSGIYKDTKGYKVMDVTLGEAISKFAGFQPKSVADDGEASSFKQRTKSFYIQTSADIKAQWADAVFRKDDAALERVRERLAAWNRNNPSLPITVKIPDIMKRVREMGKDREQRINDTAPKALRQQFREMSLEASR